MWLCTQVKNMWLYVHKCCQIVAIVLENIVNIEFEMNHDTVAILMINGFAFLIIVYKMNILYNQLHIMLYFRGYIGFEA